MRRNTKIGKIALLASVTTMITGCTIFQIEEEKVQDLDYTIVNETSQPEEVQILVENNQENEMKMSYTDQGMKYLIIGYGAQETSGYSVVVEEVYETDNAIWVDTNLIGPTSSEDIVELITYPYIVISIEANQKPIIYE